MREPKQIMQAPRYFIQVPTYSITGLKLSSTDKLVYGQILTMLNVSGTCFMSNAKMAEPIEVKPRAVSRSVSKLRDAGLINVKLTYKGETKEVDKRYITINPTSNMTIPPHVKKGHTPTSKKGIPHVKNDVVNILFNRLLNIYIKSHQINLNDDSLKEFINSDSYQFIKYAESNLTNAVVKQVFYLADKKQCRDEKLTNCIVDSVNKLIDSKANTIAKANKVLGIKHEYSSDSNYMKLAELLFRRIRKNDANFKRPNLQHWADDMRKLVEIDKRTCKQVQDVIVWCQNDSFWRSNILSAAKLRKQYSTLLIQSKSSKGNINEQLPEWAMDGYKHEEENTAVDPNKAAEMKERIKKIQARRDA